MLLLLILFISTYLFEYIIFRKSQKLKFAEVVAAALGQHVIFEIAKVKFIPHSQENAMSNFSMDFMQLLVLRSLDVIEVTQPTVCLLFQFYLLLFCY